jgi:hypothetical protein
MTDVDPELLKNLLEQPFLTIEPGDTVILAIDGTWNKEQIEALGSYLAEWAPQVQWQAIHETGFTGVIHIKAPRREPLILPSTTR